MNEAEKKAWMKKELELLGYSGPGRIIDSLEALERLKKNIHSENRITQCGFPTLSKLTDGFEGGELIILSGPTKHGKTLFAQSMTDNMALQGIGCLWFSYEMTAKQFLNRFDPVPLFYLPDELVSTSPTWLEDKIWEAKLKFNIKVVFIDHLHFLVDMAHMKNPSLEIGALVRKIKKIAVKLNVIIFLICHLTKTNLDEEPTEKDLRDSSFIAQDADSTIMIWRNLQEYTAWVTVRNHRRTGVYGEGFPVTKHLTRLVEATGWEK